MILDMGLPINNLLSWKNLMLMTLGFSFIEAPLGITPFIGMLVAALIFGLSHIDEKVRNPKNKKERQEAFIASLVFGLLGSYIAAWFLLAQGLKQSEGIGNLSVAAGGGIIAGLGLGVIMTAICVSFFINYGTVLGWWTPTGGLVTLLISIIPAMAIRRNVGINILVSFIVSSFVYALLVGDNKNKKEPWMVGQSAYIGIMIGSAVALALPSSGDVISSETKQKILEQTGLSSGIFAKSGEGAINSMALVVWFVYFIIWILTHVPGALPYGWDTLFKYK